MEPDRDTIRRRANALPHTAGEDTVNESAALAIIEDLKRNGSHIPEHIKQQIIAINQELGTKLFQDASDEHFEITPSQLRGIIARAAIAGAAQAVSDTGESLIDIESLRELFAPTGHDTIIETDQSD